MRSAALAKEQSTMMACCRWHVAEEVDRNTMRDKKKCSIFLKNSHAG